MSKHRKRHHYRSHRRRSNPLGISSGVVKDVAYNAVGAVGSIALTRLFPSFSAGWMGVAATGLAAVASSFAAKAVLGAAVAEEVLKGGLTAMAIRAIQQSGAFPVSLGLYAQSQFAVPTSSDAYGRTLASPYGMAVVASKGKAMNGYPRFASRFH